MQLFRYLDRPDALKREVDTQTAGVGTVLDGFAGDWRWTLTGAYDHELGVGDAGGGLGRVAQAVGHAPVDIAEWIHGRVACDQAGLKGGRINAATRRSLGVSARCWTGLQATGAGR